MIKHHAFASEALRGEPPYDWQEAFMTHKFQAGDNVRHKSGDGPNMIVLEYVTKATGAVATSAGIRSANAGTASKVKCHWWDKKKSKFVADEFIEAELVPWDDDGTLPVTMG